jgi:hypothetical protein
MPGPVLCSIYINDPDTSTEAGRPPTFTDDANEVRNKIDTTAALTNWREMNTLIVNTEKQ